MQKSLSNHNIADGQSKSHILEMAVGQSKSHILEMAGGQSKSHYSVFHENELSAQKHCGTILDIITIFCADWKRIFNRI